MSRKDQLRIDDYLEHILQALERIDRYVLGLEEADFLGMEEKQDAVIRNIEIIGEAARNIERYHPDYAAEHDHVPWPEMYLMRNRLSHGYFTVDIEIVWQTVQRDLPVLRQQIQQLLHPPSRNSG